MSVSDTLTHIQSWYDEASQGGTRPKLLSKLAVIELCGWLEDEFDQIIRGVDTETLQDGQWTKTELLDRTNGFKYDLHFRPMLTKLVGEHTARKVEVEMESRHPGDLDQLKSLLGTLWSQRCSFAHADMHANVRSQQTFQAPSWAINQHRLLKRIVDRYQSVLMEVVRPPTAS